MATGSDFSQQYFGYFDSRSQPRIEGLPPRASNELLTNTYSGIWSSRVPFPDLNPNLHLYSLGDRVQILDLKESRFKEFTLPDPAAVSAANIQDVTLAIGQLHNILKTATNAYKTAIATNAENLENCYHAYNQAAASLGSVLQKYTGSSLLASNDAYLNAKFTLSNECSEDRLFAILPLSQAAHVAPQDAAHTALDDYTKRKAYFENQGRFAPDSVKRLYLAESVYALNECLERLSPIEKHTFYQAYLNDPSLMAEYQYHKVAYLQRMPTHEFNREAMKFLFDMTQKEPSPQLRRQAFLDPAQRAELHRLQELKRNALAQAPDLSYLKQTTRGLSAAYWCLYDSVSTLRYGQEMSAEDIVLKAFRVSDKDWFTSRPLGNYLDENDAHLLLLMEQQESTPQAAEARKLATLELARRVAEHASNAWTQPRIGQLSIDARKHHAESAQDRQTSLLHLRHILDALADDKDGIFGRLDVLARLNHLNPSEFWKHVPGTTASRLETNYQSVQDLLMKLTGSISKAIELSEKEINRLALNQQQKNALLYDDCCFLLRFIPSYTYEDTHSSRTVSTSQEHPGFETKLFQGLKDLKGALEAKKAALATQMQQQLDTTTINAITTAMHNAAAIAGANPDSIMQAALNAPGATTLHLAAATQPLLPPPAPAPTLLVHLHIRAPAPAPAPTPIQQAAVQLHTAATAPNATRASVAMAIHPAGAPVVAAPIVTITAANVTDISITSDYLLSVFDELIRRAQTLTAPTPAPADFNTRTFMVNKTKLLTFLAEQKLVAKNIFDSTFEPNPVKRTTYFQNVFRDLHAIENYIVAIETSAENAPALQAALNQTKGRLFGVYPGYQRAYAALNVPYPMDRETPTVQKFQLPTHLEAYRTGS